MADRRATHPDRVRQLFDAKAPTWSAKYAPKGRLTGRLTRLADAVTYYTPAGGSVLDLGCGTGELATAIAAAGMRTTGCDISPEMLSRAAAADPSGMVDWVQLDPGWQRLPFGPETFDAVAAASVLEYVEDPVTVLRECGRVLRPGGFVLCTAPDPRHPIRWLEWLARIAARLPSSAAVRGWRRLDSYATYLQISRQRHPAHWWQATAREAGLLAPPSLVDTRQRSPLRLLTFQRAGGEGTS